MGRRSDAHLRDTTSLCIIVPVPLDEGGYDEGGAYWGIGKALWMVEGVDEEHLDFQCRMYLRGPDIETVKQNFPSARWSADDR